MQMRVISGPGLRVAVVVQDADGSPIEPISDTLLSSAVKHSRGVYQVPEFFYEESYTIGDAPTTLAIGKLPLPNFVQGEVLGGDYGVKQSADVNLLNPTNQPADVGLWFEPRGGRATGTLLVNGDVVQLHPVDAYEGRARAPLHRAGARLHARERGDDARRRIGLSGQSAVRIGSAARGGLESLTRGPLEPRRRAALRGARSSRRLVLCP